MWPRSTIPGPRVVGCVSGATIIATPKNLQGELECRLKI
jgi:hypothetical protein